MGELIERLSDWTITQRYVKVIIILSFLCLKFIWVAYYIARNVGHNSILYVVLLIAYSTFALFSFKQNKIGRIATCIIVICILLTALNSFVVGAVASPDKQLVFKILSILFGLFLSCCGIILILQEKGNRNTPKREGSALDKR
jgi:hypothetical protein